MCEINEIELFVAIFIGIVSLICIAGLCICMLIASKNDYPYRY